MANMSGGGSKRRRATACSYQKNSCRSRSCGSLWSCSPRFTPWLVRRPMRRISIRANRRRGCLRIVARPVIAARQLSRGGAPVPSYSSSCRSITRPVRTRPRNSPLISPRSTPGEAAGRGLWERGRRGPRHQDRPNRRRPRHRIEKLSFVAAFQQRRIAHDCEATIAGLRLGTTTRRANSPLL
jgi:hypothetical protein